MREGTRYEWPLVRWIKCPTNDRMMGHPLMPATSRYMSNMLQCILCIHHRSGHLYSAGFGANLRKKETYRPRCMGIQVSAWTPGAFPFSVVTDIGTDATVHSSP